MTKSKLIKILNLEPLSVEGGWFNEVFRDGIDIPKAVLPPSFKSKDYTASTSIYYMLSSEDVSSMHAVSAAETWHFYRGGDPSVFVELLVVSPSGEGTLVRLGSKIEEGESPQHTIPSGHWMGARIRFREGLDSELAWALTGATVAPSFEYADFVKGDAGEIAALCPKYAEIIKVLG